MGKNKHQSAINADFTDHPKAHLLKALDVNPYFSDAHYQLALIYQENGEFNEAETHFKKAIESDRQLIVEIEKRSEILLVKYEYQYAKIFYMKSQRIKEHCAEINYKLADFYMDINKPAEAQIFLKNSIDLNPTFGKAHCNLGILLVKEKSYDVARIHIERALELNYSDCFAHLTLGMIMKFSKDYAAAELHYLTALDINPDFSVCMLEMALLQIIMKNQINAIKYYKKAREISPKISNVKLDRILRESTIGKVERVKGKIPKR